MAVGTSSRYFEDLTVGETFDLGSETVTEDEMVSFAERYDPQPIHTDSEAAAKSMFGGIVASGWYTVAVSMRRFVNGIIKQEGIAMVAGMEVEHLQWRRPIRPGDTLHSETKIVDLNEWDEENGVVHFDLQTRTGNGELALQLTKRALVEHE